MQKMQKKLNDLPWSPRWENGGDDVDDYYPTDLQDPQLSYN